jgi:hypothetical protein
MARWLRGSPPMSGLLSLRVSNPGTASHRQPPGPPVYAAPGRNPICLSSTAPSPALAATPSPNSPLTQSRRITNLGLPYVPRKRRLVNLGTVFADKWTVGARLFMVQTRGNEKVSWSAWAQPCRKRRVTREGGERPACPKSYSFAETHRFLSLLAVRPQCRHLNSGLPTRAAGTKLASKTSTRPALKSAAYR